MLLVDFLSRKKKLEVSFFGVKMRAARNGVRRNRDRMGPPLELRRNLLLCAPYARVPLPVSRGRSWMIPRGLMVPAGNFFSFYILIFPLYALPASRCPPRGSN